MTGPETAAERRRRLTSAARLLAQGNAASVTPGQRAVAASMFRPLTAEELGMGTIGKAPEQTPAESRGVRVAIGAEDPRLSERIAPDSRGVAGALGDVAEGVENAVRGVPQGVAEGIYTLADAAVTGGSALAAGSGAVDPVRAAEFQQRFREEQVQPAMAEAAEVFQAEGTPGAVGRVAGAFLPAGGAAVGTTRAVVAGAEKLLPGMGRKLAQTLAEGSLPARTAANVAVNAPLDVAYGLTDPNQSGDPTDDILLNLALSGGGAALVEGARTPGLMRRAREAAGNANSANLSDLGRVGRATARMEAADRLARLRAESRPAEGMERLAQAERRVAVETEPPGATGQLVREADEALLAPRIREAQQRAKLQADEARAAADPTRQAVRAFWERRSMLSDESGAASPAVAGALGGAAAGGAIGAATSEPGERLQGAATGALVGGLGGAMLVKAASRRGQPLNRAQLVLNDPDARAILAEGVARPSRRQKVSGARAELLGKVHRGWQALLDDVYALRKFGREVGKTEDVSEEASRARGWRGFGDALIGRYGGGDPSPHPTLRRAVEGAKGHEADVTALLRAERAIELDDAGKKWYLAADRPTTLRAIAKLSAVPEVRAAADELRAFYDYLLELRYEAGLLDDAQYQAVRAAHQKYVPFVPDAEAGPRPAIAGGGLFNRARGLRQLTEGAGGYAKVDPFVQAAEDAYRTARDVSRQRVMQSVASIVRQYPDEAAPFIRELPAQGQRAATRSAEGRTIDAIVNGERVRFEVLDDDLFEALSSVGPHSQGILLRLFGAFANALRTGVTIVPSFGAANAQRDAFFSARAFPAPVRQGAAGGALGAAIGALSSEDRKEGALIGAGLGVGAGTMGTHALRIMRGLSDVLGNSAMYQEWMREGGAGFGFYAESRRDFDRLVQRMRSGTRLSDVVNPRSWWDAVHRLNEAIEQAPRVAKFSADRAAGLSPRAAAVGSREVSVDFSRKGSDPVVRGLGRASAFWNPNLQGKAKLAEVFKSPKAWAIGLATMTAPSVALWAINRDDPEYWRRPLWERNLFWLVPAGHHEDGRTRFLKIPKPFEVGYVFGSLPERLLDFAYKKDPERAAAAVLDMARSAGAGIVPVPTAILPLAETQVGDRGFDTFRQRPIVTSDVDQLPSRDQANLDTKGPAIALSRAIDAATFGMVQPSPQKVEHVIRGWTGTLGSRALAAGDRVGKALGLDDRPEGVREEPSQWDRFVTRPFDFSSDDVDRMFRRFDRAERHYRRAKGLLDAGDDEAARAYVAEHRDALRDYFTLKSQVNDFRKVVAARRRIEQMPRLSVERRRLAIQRLGRVAAAVAAGEAPEGQAVAGVR